MTVRLTAAVVTLFRYLGEGEFHIKFAKIKGRHGLLYMQKTTAECGQQ